MAKLSGKRAAYMPIDMQGTGLGDLSLMFCCSVVRQDQAACGAIRGSHRTSGGGGAEASGDASLRVAAGATDASLLYRDAFGEVAGLVDVQTLRDAHVIAEKLKGNHGKTADEVAVDLGDIDRKVVGVLDIVVPVAGQAHEIGAAGLALGHVADGFLIEIALRQNADDQGVVFSIRLMVPCFISPAA